MRKLVLVLATLVAISARAEQKNVLVLTNLSDAQLGLAMNNMAASLGVHCDFCHAADPQTKRLDFPSDAKEEKKTGREMIRMVLEINEKNFKGRPIIGCYTCHLGKENPSAMVSLPLPVIPPAKPREAEEAERKAYPTAKEVMAKYVAAIGGEAAAKKLSTESMIVKGTRTTANGQTMPMELYRSGGKMLVRATPAEGPAMAQMVSAEGGWMQSREGVRTISGGDAALSVTNAHAYDPIPPALPDNARVFRKETIDGHEAWAVGAQIDEHTRERISFDATTGLPLRRVLTFDSPVGRIPLETDYEDYREVSGAKVPFTVRLSSVNGGQSSTRKYTSIEFGAKVDEKMFEAPPK
ncbi:MAG TPA: c-type cytochrome [Thermoanaerobaculia bacterium]|nr:c-type cytochrome [Thermoanaerobaculia bacterium]